MENIEAFDNVFRFCITLWHTDWETARLARSGPCNQFPSLNRTNKQQRPADGVSKACEIRAMQDGNVNFVQGKEEAINLAYLEEIAVETSCRRSAGQILNLSIHFLNAQLHERLSNNATMLRSNRQFQ